MMKPKEFMENIARQFIKNRLLGIYTIFISWDQLMENSQCEDCWDLFKKIRKNFRLNEKEEKLLKERECLLLLHGGIRYQKERNFEQAKKAYLKGLAIARELKNKDGVGQFSIALVILETESAGGKRNSSFQHLENDAGQKLAAHRQFLPRFLDDESWLTRREAIYALAELNEIDPVIRALEHENIQTRIDAICALEKMADKRAANRMIEILQDNQENWFLRWRAAIILGKIQCAEAFQMLNKARFDNEAFVRVGAFEALGMLLSEDIIASVTPGLDDNDPDVRMSVIHILGNIGNEAVVSNLKKIEDGVDSIGRKLKEEAVIAVQKIESRTKKSPAY